MDYLGHLKNYNKIKAKDLDFKYLSSNDSSLILQCDDRKCKFPRAIRYLTYATDVHTKYYFPGKKS